MGDVVGPLRVSGGGRDGIASNKRKDGGFDGERAEAGDKGELPTQNTDPTPASLSTGPTAIILFSELQRPRLQRHSSCVMTRSGIATLESRMEGWEG